MSERHDLGVESQVRYAFVAQLLRRDLPAPADVLELGAAPGDQIAALAGEGYRATSIDLGEAPDEWGSGGHRPDGPDLCRERRPGRPLGSRAGAVPAAG